MEQKMLAYVIVALIAVIIAAAVLLRGYGSTGNTAMANTAAPAGPVSSTQSATPASNTSAVLFSSTPYYQYAYLVSDSPLSSQAKAALAGFNFNNTQLANGTRKITIELAGTSQSQTVMLKPGYKLYIIEATFGDDGYGFDSSLGDDGFVMVNQTGYVA